MIKFCQQVFKEAKVDYKDILQSSFNQQLIFGDLDQRIFISFLYQDRYFVETQARIIDKFLTKSKSYNQRGLISSDDLLSYKLLSNCYQDIQQFEIVILTKLINRHSKISLVVSDSTMSYINYIEEISKRAILLDDSYLLLITILPCLESFHLLVVYYQRLRDSLKVSHSSLYKTWLKGYCDQRISVMIRSFRRVLDSKIDAIAISKRSASRSTILKAEEYKATYRRVIQLEKEFISQDFSQSYKGLKL